MGYYALVQLALARNRRRVARFVVAGAFALARRARRH